MKKIFLSVLVFSMLATLAGAGAQGISQRRSPVFSPALFQGYDKNKRSGSQEITQRTPTQGVTTFLYFASGQTELTQAQKEQLVPVIKRLGTGETKMVRAVGVSKSRIDSQKRLNRLAIFFRDYKGDVPFEAHVVDPKNVINNDNVVQIIEKR
ncbi:MAG: hypothetical protein LBU87_04275 [Lactobacillales bacterium]|jgi:hypothetical protein|nr:hypothetical protein [Lactobacillales bacterium]